MDDALFSIFPPTPDADWEKQLARELKGASYEEKLLWSPPELPADAPKIRPYYRRTDAPPPPPLPRLRPFRYFSAFEVRADTRATDVQHAAGKARQRDAAGLDLWGSSADLARLRTSLEAGAAPFPFRYFANDLPNSPQSLPDGVLYDLCGLRASSGGRGPCLDPSAWDRISAQIEAEQIKAGEPASPLGYLDGALFANAGADLPTELALIWAALHETIDELSQRGLPPETWTDRWVLRVAAGPNFFLELVKFRALRLGWDLLGSALPVREQAAKTLPCPDILGSALQWNLAASDAHNNLLRMTTEAAAAMLGGADALSLPRFDAPSGRQPVTDSDFSRRISDNLALLLDKESHLLRVDDPAAGSWYLEQLTDELGRQAWARFQQIEALGGYTAALQSGEVQGWILQARERKAAILRQPGTGWIGVTRFRPAAASTATALEHNKTYGSSSSSSGSGQLPAEPNSSNQLATEPDHPFPPILPWLAEQALSPAETAAANASAPKTTAP